METEHNTSMPPVKKKSSCLRLILKIIKTCLIFILGMLFAVWIMDEGGIDKSDIVSKLKTLEFYISNYALNDFDEETAEAGVYQGFLKGLGDDYAQYYTKEEYQQLMNEDSGEYKGIGVSVYKDATTGLIGVSQVFKGDPAYKAGIKSGDLIKKIDDTETADLTLNEAVSLIKSGDKDEITLTIVRQSEEMEVLVEKTDIEIDSVSYEMKDGKIGYISVSQFIETTPRQFNDAVDKLLEEGMQSMIIDLRDNGGGLLDSCIDMVSRIIPEDKLIVYTEDKNGERQEFKSNSDETLTIPIVMLINGNTASASEIMTGCLKDYGLATVVGVQSFGKGIVQNIYPLTDGTGLKFTVSKYYTPKGNDIHQKGIDPDVTVEMTEEEWMEALEDPTKDKQLDKALEILKEK